MTPPWLPSVGAVGACPRGNIVEEGFTSPPGAQARQESSTFSRPAMQLPLPALLPPEDVRALPVLLVAVPSHGWPAWSRAVEKKRVARGWEVDRSNEIVCFRVKTRTLGTTSTAASGPQATLRALSVWQWSLCLYVYGYKGRKV